MDDHTHLAMDASALAVARFRESSAWITAGFPTRVAALAEQRDLIDARLVRVRKRLAELRAEDRVRMGTP